eukprot:gene3644-2579_t
MLRHAYAGQSIALTLSLLLADPSSGTIRVGTEGLRILRVIIHSFSLCVLVCFRGVSRLSTLLFYSIVASQKLKAGERVRHTLSPLLNNCCIYSQCLNSILQICQTRKQNKKKHGSTLYRPSPHFLHPIFILLTHQGDSRPLTISSSVGRVGVMTLPATRLSHQILHDSGLFSSRGRSGSQLSPKGPGAQPGGPPGRYGPPVPTEMPRERSASSSYTLSQPRARSGVGKDRPLPRLEPAPPSPSATNRQCAGIGPTRPGVGQSSGHFPPLHGGKGGAPSLYQHPGTPPRENSMGLHFGQHQLQQQLQQQQVLSPKWGSPPPAPLDASPTSPQAARRPNSNPNATGTSASFIGPGSMTASPRRSGYIPPLHPPTRGDRPDSKLATTPPIKRHFVNSPTPIQSYGDGGAGAPATAPGPAGSLYNRRQMRNSTGSVPSAETERSIHTAASPDSDSASSAFESPAVSFLPSDAISSDEDAAAGETNPLTYGSPGQKPSGLVAFTRRDSSKLEAEPYPVMSVSDLNPKGSCIVVSMAGSPRKESLVTFGSNFPELHNSYAEDVGGVSLLYEGHFSSSRRRPSENFLPPPQVSPRKRGSVVLSPRTTPPRLSSAPKGLKGLTPASTRRRGPSGMERLCAALGYAGHLVHYIGGAEAEGGAWRGIRLAFIFFPLYPSLVVDEHCISVSPTHIRKRNSQGNFWLNIIIFSLFVCWVGDNCIQQIRSEKEAYILTCHATPSAAFEHHLSGSRRNAHVDDCARLYTLVYICLSSARRVSLAGKRGGLCVAHACVIAACSKRLFPRPVRETRKRGGSSSSHSLTQMAAPIIRRSCAIRTGRDGPKTVPQSPLSLSPASFSVLDGLSGFGYEILVRIVYYIYFSLFIYVLGCISTLFVSRPILFKHFFSFSPVRTVFYYYYIYIVRLFRGAVQDKSTAFPIELRLDSVAHQGSPFPPVTYVEPGTEIGSLPFPHPHSLFYTHHCSNVAALVRNEYPPTLAHYNYPLSGLYSSYFLVHFFLEEKFISIIDCAIQLQAQHKLN